MEIMENYYTKNFNTFDEWLELVRQDEFVYPRFRIPYHEWMNEYIDSIENRSEEEVKELLRYLLLPFTRKIDRANCESFYCLNNDPNKYLEMYKRLENGQDAWEGLTWVLQYLPYSPYKAIRALTSYHDAEVCYMPDDRIIGINQCKALIEAKFIYTNKGLENAIFDLKPREFEWLIEILYKDIGYETELTPATRDGGKDIIANIKREDGNERVYVECKLYKTTELAKQTVEAFGYRINKDNISRGILFCTGYVNDNIKSMDERIQIWTLDEIIFLLNAHIGTDWNLRLKRLIDNQRRKYVK
ncbi:restriction endonuclease [Proteiniborus sp. MB09-C3]|uniref:restriction endonuclease n=1 Tax=Proteiniborus sp. MB09-C3 TaxID=3050072 RepID=UPI002553AB72|nr:restriction endonuclease [Proteiniborus sp. MB09-C3]WIV11106.1 restriction endonuclease [Proteiniborus sp. MB09-C3]